MLQHVNAVSESQCCLAGMSEFTVLSGRDQWSGCSPQEVGLDWWISTASGLYAAESKTFTHSFYCLLLLAEFGFAKLVLIEHHDVSSGCTGPIDSCIGGTLYESCIDSYVYNVHHFMMYRRLWL